MDKHLLFHLPLETNVFADWNAPITERYEDAYTVDADASRAETDSVEESEVSITPEYEEATTKREFTDPEYEANDATHHQGPWLPVLHIDAVNLMIRVTRCPCRDDAEGKPVGTVRR